MPDESDRGEYRGRTHPRSQGTNKAYYQQGAGPARVFPRPGVGYFRSLDRAPQVIARFGSSTEIYKFLSEHNFPYLQPIEFVRIDGRDHVNVLHIDAPNLADTLRDMWAAGRHEEAVRLYAEKMGNVIRELLKLPVGGAPQVPYVSCGDENRPGDTQAYAEFYIDSSVHQVLRPHLKEYENVWAAADITENPYLNVDATELVPERFYVTTNDIKAGNIQGDFLIDTEDTGVAPLSMIFAQIEHYSAGDPWAEMGNALIFSSLHEEGVITREDWRAIQQNKSVMRRIKVIESGVNDVIRACRRAMPFQRLSRPQALVEIVNRCHQAGLTEKTAKPDEFLSAVFKARRAELGKIDPASVVNVIPSEERVQMLRTLRPPNGGTRAMGPQYIAGNRLARLLENPETDDPSEVALEWAQEHSHPVLVSRNFGTAIVHSASQLSAFSGVTIVAAPGKTTTDQLAAGCSLVDTLAEEAHADELFLVVATNQIGSFLYHLEDNVFNSLFQDTGARVPAALLIEPATSLVKRRNMEESLKFRPGINPTTGVYRFLYNVPDLIDRDHAKRFSNLSPKLFIAGDLSHEGFPESWRKAVIEADRRAYLKNLSEFYVLEAEQRAISYISAPDTRPNEQAFVKARDRSGPWNLIMDITQYAASLISTSNISPPYVLSYRPPDPTLGPVVAELTYAPKTMPAGGDAIAIASPDFLVHPSPYVDAYWMEGAHRTLWWNLIAQEDMFDDVVPRLNGHHGIVLLCSPGPLAEDRRAEMFNEIEQHLKFLGKKMVTPEKLEIVGEKLVRPLTAPSREDGSSPQTRPPRPPPLRAVRR